MASSTQQQNDPNAAAASPHSPTAANSASPTSPNSPTTRPGPNPTRVTRTSTTASLATNASSRLRSASLKLLDTDLPPGFMAATGNAGARVHSFAEIRRGSLGGPGASPVSPVSGVGEGGGGRRRFSRTSTGLSSKSGGKGKGGAGNEVEHSRLEVAQTPLALETVPSAVSRPESARNNEPAEISTVKDSTASSATRTITADTSTAPETYANGYRPPPKLPWTTSTALALKAYGKWVLTIPGFLITVYGLNVVAWGGMLFLLLCNAAPAMCHPACNDINSPRRIWIEIDSQILNALFCVTGFGLIPWRFRDWWWWGVWRFGFGKQAWGPTRAERRRYGIRRLAGYNRNWFRLPGSEKLPPLYPTAQEEEVGLPAQENPAVPVPASRIPDPPPTGARAPPTKSWKMDFVVWCNVGNTFLQACLCGFMWGMNRYDRPSWSTGLFVGLACAVAGMGGFCMFLEGKAVKKVEGVPMSTWMDQSESTGDEEKATAAAKEGKDGEKRKEETELKESPAKREGEEAT